MVTRTAIHSAVGVIGNVISYGLFLSPVPTFYKIYKKKDVEDFSPVPYVATLLNCMLWVFYGIPVVKVDDGTLIVTVNGGGFVLESIYLSIFFFYAPKDRRVKVLKYLAIEFVFVAAVVIGVVVGAHSHKLRERIVGILCIIFGTCMYASPLSVMKLVVTTRSVEYMPFFLSLAGFLNGVCWTAYALIIFDINVLIPNGLGALLGLAQLILYGCYFRSTPKKSSRSSTTQVELPAV